MKSKGEIITISCKKDLGVLLALCLLQAVIAIPNLIKGWEIEASISLFASAVIASIVCLIGMRIGLTVDTENREIIRKTFFRTRKIDFISIKSVKIEKVFLGKAITIIGDNGKVFDKTRFILYKENYIVPENFVAYFSTGCYDRDLLLPSKKLEKECAMSSKIALATLAIIQIGLLAIMIYFQIPKYPIMDIKLYGYGHFWIIVGIAVLTLIGLFVKNRYRGITEFIAVILYLGYPFFALFVGLAGSNEDYFVSYTDDFANYDDVIAEEWDDDDGDSYFPSEIDGEAVDFSYYYKYYWDSITEIYLEVKYSDEEFATIYSKYPAKEESYFGEQYEEVNFKNEWFGTYEYEDGLYIDHASCDKILFDKTTNTVIYYHLYAIDAFDPEWCKLVQRFDLDIFDYEEYVDTKREENKDKVNQT